MKVDIFDDTRCVLGEGPIWDGGRQELRWVDIKSRKIYTKNLVGGVSSSLDTIKMPSALGLCNSGSIVVAHQNEIVLLESPDKNLCSIGEREHNRTNDGKIGPDGRFWFGTMDNNEELDSGCLYSWHPESGLQCHLREINISNTFVWSPDTKYMYFADSKLQLIWRFSFDVQTSSLSKKPEIFVSLKGTEFYPDGSAMDAEGYLWNAQWGGSRIVRYSPEGEVDRVVALPVSQPTSCCFGGENLEFLFVTSASTGVEHEGSAGQTFVIHTGQYDIFGEPVSTLSGL